MLYLYLATQCRAGVKWIEIYIYKVRPYSSVALCQKSNQPQKMTEMLIICPDNLLHKTLSLWYSNFNTLQLPIKSLHDCKLNKEARICIHYTIKTYPSLMPKRNESIYHTGKSFCENSQILGFGNVLAQISAEKRSKQFVLPTSEPTHFSNTLMYIQCTYFLVLPLSICLLQACQTFCDHGIKDIYLNNAQKAYLN